MGPITLAPTWPNRAVPAASTKRNGSPAGGGWLVAGGVARRQPNRRARPTAIGASSPERTATRASVPAARGAGAPDPPATDAAISRAGDAWSRTTQAATSVPARRADPRPRREIMMKDGNIPADRPPGEAFQAGERGTARPAAGAPRAAGLGGDRSLVGADHAHRPEAPELGGRGELARLERLLRRPVVVALGPQAAAETREAARRQPDVVRPVHAAPGAAPRPARSSSARRTSAFVSATLYPLCGRGSAAARAASAARPADGTSTAWPTIAASPSLERQGIGATPPSTRRAPAHDVPCNRRAAATLTRAKSIESFSLNLRLRLLHP